MNILILGPTWRNDPIKEFLETRGDQVFMSNDRVDLAFAQKYKIDWILSSGYGPILKDPLVSHYKDRIVNLHATYLPYGKGIGTTFFGFLAGTPAGVSLHFIDSGIDTGDILFRKKIEPKPDDTLRTFYATLLDELRLFFIEKWDDLQNGRYERIRQQDLNIDVDYHSRVESEKFMDLLPLKWDTPIEFVKKLGADFSLGKEFWQHYDDEIKGL